MKPINLPALTGLRIVGALWVALFHYRDTFFLAWPMLSFLDPIFSAGYFGVPLFFILSGYLIWHNYGSEKLLEVRATTFFLWRRIARLWPVNLLSQLLAIPLIWYGITVKENWGAPVPDWYSITGWLQSAFMIQEFFSPTQIYPWNQPSWSLSGEMGAYVLFPVFTLIILSLRLNKIKLKGVFTVTAFLGAFYLSLTVHYFPYSWLVYLVAIFCLGILIRLGGIPTRFMQQVAIGMQIVAPLVVVWVCYSGNLIYMYLALAIWVWSLTTEKGYISNFFASRKMIFAGEASYSLYMMHWILYGYLFILFESLPESLTPNLKIQTVIVFTMLGIISWATWKYIEKPSRNRMNRFLSAKWPQTKHS